MSTRQSHIFTRTDAWREGAWLDLWSVVHLLSGTSIGLGAYALHLTPTLTTLLVLFLLVSYELWEAFVHITEAVTNRCMDVVVGMVGYSLTFYLLGPLLSLVELWCGLSILVLTTTTLSVFGWHASQKAAALKQRVLARYAAERALLNI